VSLGCEAAAVVAWAAVCWQTVCDLFAEAVGTPLVWGWLEAMVEVVLDALRPALLRKASTCAISDIINACSKGIKMAVGPRVYRGTQIPKVSLKFEKKSWLWEVCNLMHFEPSMQRWARQRPVTR